MMIRLLLISALLLFSLNTFGQGSTSKTKGTVYIYKTWHVATLWRAAFAIFLDDKMIARLDRGVYLVAEIDPGKHSFSTKSKKSGGVELDIEAGKVYVLRLETDSGMQVTNPHLSVPPIEQIKFDLKQMKPIEKKDIKKDGEGIVLFPSPSIP